MPGDNTPFFRSQIRNSINAVRMKGVSWFSGFLSLAEQTIAREELSRESFHDAVFFGGDSSCERVVLGLFPDSQHETGDFPISAVEIHHNPRFSLTHRDFLGALMGLEIKRDLIGDILCEDGRAVIFCKDHIAGFIVMNLNKVGSVGVKTFLYSGDDLPERQYQDWHVIVTSLRLDCVISSLTHLSRDKAAQLIHGEKVSLNGIVTKESDKKINPGCVISIRGFGKFQFVSVDGKTQKDKVRLSFSKYV